MRILAPNNHIFNKHNTGNVMDRRDFIIKQTDFGRD